MGVQRNARGASAKIMNADTATQSTTTSSFWTDDFDWPFGKPPPTRDYLFSQGQDADALHLLGLNEAPFAPSDRVASALQRAAHYLNRYPDNVHEELTKAVEARHHIPAERQVWGSGAGELIYRAVALATQAGFNIVSHAPTFWGYERVFLLQKARVHRTGLKPDGTLDVEAFLSAIDRDTGIVTFATPGNPSGISLSEDEIVHIARNTPDNALLMADEVYHEFCAHEGGPDVLDILQRVRKAPWIVLRSFSKAYRLAGARVGYGFASDNATARRIRERSLNFTISSTGFAAALAAFEDRQELEKYLIHNADIKNKLSENLRAIGLQPMPSAANFVSVEMPQPSSEIIPELANKKIICAGWNHPDFPNNIRIGIANEASNAAVVEALRQMIAR